MTGIAAVHARIAEIHGSFGSPAVVAAQAPPPPAASRAVGTLMTSATGPSFSAALAGATAPPSTTPEVRPGPPAGGAVTGDAVVAAGRAYLGVPYVWGGTDPATGLDCSGFVQQVYQDLGIALPRVSRDQAKAGRAVESLAAARPGDLVAFGSPVDHIGIYAGDGKMLVAPRSGDVVKVQDVYRTPSAIRRILPDDPAAGSAASAALAPARGTGGASAYAQLFATSGATHGVSPALLTAVARTESAFDPGARSPAGALGLMQFMPATAREMGIDPLDPVQAVDGAARLLKSHLQRFGSTELALAAYNAGPGAVTRHGGVPPYRETQDYVRKIMNELRVEAA